MEIFQRQKFNEIEGINLVRLRQILSRSQNEGIPSIDSIIFDTILLDDNTKIKCIKNYYATINSGAPKKGKANNTCVAIHKFYKVDCRPYDCISCHLQMIMMKEHKDVKIIKK